MNNYPFRPQNGTFDVFNFADNADRHQIGGNATAYDLAVRQVYVIGHIWGWSGSEEPDPAVANNRVSAEVTCLQASSVLRESANEGGNQDGGGGNQQNGGSGNQNAAQGLRMGLSLGADSLLFLAFTATVLLISS